MNDFIDGRRNLFIKDGQKGDGRDDIDNSHGRDDFGSRPGNGLQAADGDSSHNDSENDCRIFDGDICRKAGNFDDGIDLCKGTDAKEGNQYAKESKEDSQGLVLLSQPVFDVVHRTADIITLFISFAEMNGKCDLSEFRAHSKDCGDPHPEDSPWPAGMNSRGNADDITCPDRCGQSRAESFETIDIAFPLIFRRKDQFQSPRQTEHL